MFLEIWQLIVLVVLSAGWAEYRAYISYKKGTKIGIDSMAKVAIQELDKIEEDLAFQRSFVMIKYLINRGLIKIDPETGILEGYNGMTINLDEEAKKTLDKPSHL